MASAGIQFVASANAAPAANGLAAGQAFAAAAEGAPIDFAALLFAAQTSALPPEFAELATAGASASDPVEDTETAEGTSDLALLLGGLILPQAAQPAMTPAAPSAAQVALADEQDLAALPPGKQLTLLTDGDTTETGKLSELLAKDGKGEPPANLAEPAQSVPTGNNGNHFGQLLGNHGASSAVQPQGGAPTASVHVATALHDPQWGQDFSQRVVWMARSEMQSAHLSLNPANLGPIEVTLNLGAEQASAVFSSPHGEVREALEAALPRLREMLAGAGIALGDAQVNAQSQRDMAQSAHSQQPGQRSASSANESGAILGADDAVNTREGPRIRTGLGLVDTFA